MGEWPEALCWCGAAGALGKRCAGPGWTQTGKRGQRCPAAIALLQRHCYQRTTHQHSDQFMDMIIMQTIF